MVKPLAFKGDKPKKSSSSKKRKLDTIDNPSDSIVDTTNPASWAETTNNPAIAEEDDDTWLTPNHPTDLSGPLLLVLPTTPPTALATDAQGVIFASELENLVDGDSSTAEPHDVRQVWIATKIPGNEIKRGGIVKRESDALVQTGDSLQLSLKSCYGNYLGVDDKGALRAQGIAVGNAETFTIYRTAEDEDAGAGSNGHFTIATSYTPPSPPSPPSTEPPPDGVKAKPPPATKTYITALHPKPPKHQIQILASNPSPSSLSQSSLIIRMQTRFHPSHQLALLHKKTESAKISRSELEKQVGRRLEDEEVKRLKRANRKGELREEMLGMRVKGKGDKFAN